MLRSIQISCPASLVATSEDEFVVEFRDIPEAIASEATEGQAIFEARDALSEAIAARIVDKEPLPSTSALQSGEVMISPTTDIAAKAILYVAVGELGLTAAKLARQLHIDHKEARRILDPRHRTKIGRLEHALHIAGLSLAVRAEPLVSQPSKEKVAI